MPLLLVLAFIAVPLLELYVIIQVGQGIGALPTIAILLADSILGSVLLRSQGRATWRRFNATMGKGRVPHREILDGVMIVFGGALLLTPGFLTDVVGLLLLLPPTRAAIRRVLARVLSRRLVIGVAGPTGATVHGAGRRAGARQARAPEGEVRGDRPDVEDAGRGGRPDIEGTARDASSPRAPR